MPLTGIAVDDPTPGTRREIIFAAGSSLGSGGARSIILMGNMTASGSATLETVYGPFDNDQDFKDRFGNRAELYQNWRALIAANQGASVYGYAVTEAASSPSAATCTFTFVNAATDTTTVDLTWGGLVTSFGVASGDSVTTQAAAMVAAINSADQGTWPFTAAATVGVVTLTMAQLGDKGDLTLNRVRATYRKNVTTTLTKSAVTNGSGTDDYTTAYANIATFGAVYYQASSKHATGAVTATDNGIGEHIAAINLQALPKNGRNQMAIFGLVGTQSQQTTVCTSSAANAVRARFVWAENNDWTPGMLAAHHAGVLQLGHALHPNYNFTGYANKAGTPYTVPPPFDRNDIPTGTEIKAALNSGACPVTFNSLGSPKLVREITSYSLLPGTTTNDFRAREGNLQSSLDFTWDNVIAPRYEAQKQPTLANDPPEGAIPLPGVQYPNGVRSMFIDVINDLTGPNPLGLYTGPILNPDATARMIASIIAKKITGGISVVCDLQAAEHNNKAEVSLRETSAPQ